MRSFCLTATSTAALLALALAAQGQQPGQRPAATPAATPAAPAAPRATGRIAGTVFDGATQQPVSYASLGLLDASGQAVNGGVADAEGQFALGGVPPGTYTLEISFLGYATERRPGIAVAPGEAVALGKIPLAPSAKALGEVLVVTQKPLIEERVDRTIYNAENDQTARGGDATDVLKRVPLLSVDLDGNVTLRGNSNLRVLINNKPSTMTASSIADALRQIPADQIKTVEVITSPSAKYDAEGSGGIINIVTKGNSLQGATLGFDASVGLRASNLSLNGSVRKGRLGVSLGGFGRAGYNIPGEFENTQTTYGQPGGPATTTRQRADTRQQQAFGRYTLGFDYDLNKRNTLAASVAYGTRRQLNHQDGLLTATYAGIPDLAAPPAPLSQSLRDVYVKDLSGTVDASLNYTHTFAGKPQHEVSLLTLLSRNDRTNTFTNGIFGADGRLASRLENDNPSANTEYTVQLDYQNPVAKDQILEVGAKNILRRVTSDFVTRRATGENGPFEVLPGLGRSNSFTYNQNVTAAYAAYTLGLAKGLTFKPGLRYEYTTIAADFATTAPVPIPDYGVLVPSANLSRKLGNGNTLKLAYNRRIQRPSLQFLNPNIQAANPLSVSQGSPTLAPEYTNNYELAYNTAIKRINLNISTFVRNTTGAIQAVRTTRGDTIRTTFANIGQENAYGASVFANANSARFSLGGGVDMFYAVLENNVPDPVFNAANQGFVVSARVFGSYNFTPVWGLQAFTFVRARQVQLQGDQSAFGVYSLSIKRDFRDKRGSFGFGAENFFNASGITIVNTVSSPLIEQRSTALLRNLNFKVNLSYRVGKLTVEGKGGNKKGVKNDDLKEGEGEGGGGEGGGAPGGGRPGGKRPAPAPTGGPRPPTGK